MNQRTQQLIGLTCLILSPVLLLLYSWTHTFSPPFFRPSSFSSNFLKDFPSLLTEAGPMIDAPSSSYDGARSDIMAQMEELAASFSEVSLQPETTPDSAGLLSDQIPDLSSKTPGFAVFKEGSTLGSVLEEVGVSKEDAYEVTHALSKIYNPRQFKTGCHLSLKWENETSASPLLSECSFVVDFGKKIVVSRTPQGAYKATRVETPLNKQLHRISFSIESSVFASAASKGISSRALMPVTQALSYDLDLQRDIHSGDKVELVVEKLADSETKQERAGRILYAALHAKGRAPIRLYEFTNPTTGQTQFYNERGESLRKALMKTPISGAKISSGFGSRKDPIKGYTSKHRGVDFRAPQGTPVMAAGDGKVLLASKSGGLGNCVKISHNKTYTTAYAHLSKFANGIRPGVHVKQGAIIGYVGRTGRATGPHLHFEVHKNGVHINPNSVRSMSSGKLEGRLLKSFLAAKKNMDTRIAALPTATTLALEETSVQSA